VAELAHGLPKLRFSPFVFSHFRGTRQCHVAALRTPAYHNNKTLCHML